MQPMSVIAQRLYTDTSFLFPCYSAQAIDWSTMAVDRCFADYQATEWSEEQWKVADLNQRVALAVNRAHAARLWHLAVKEREFQVQANCDVLRGHRTLRDTYKDGREISGMFESIVPQQVRDAIYDSISTGTQRPPVVERYASGERQWEERKSE
jgi:hypothetical protein